MQMLNHLFEFFFMNSTLSELISDGIPNLGMTSLVKNLITVAALWPFDGTASTHLLNLSINTNIYLLPFTLLLMSTKSMTKCLNGPSGVGTITTPLLIFWYNQRPSGAPDIWLLPPGNNADISSTIWSQCSMGDPSVFLTPPPFTILPRINDKRRAHMKSLWRYTQIYLLLLDRQL